MGVVTVMSRRRRVEFCKESNVDALRREQCLEYKLSLSV
ncbi:hypothetical protein Sarmat_00650 [Rickettsiales endosymbiont of Paramecium tredecaurelia]|nr:hypothetical protein [Candidatus Sarmatiella mevalonica]